MKYIKYKGAKIVYNTMGTGNTIVLLHGFLENLTMWDDFAAKLSTTNKVITIDLPGFGKSEVISNNHSMSTMANAVAAVIKNEKVTKCTLVGHSMGGYVTLAFAKLFEEKLSGIVLFHSQAGAENQEMKRNRDRTIKLVEQNHGSYISNFIPLLFTPENEVKYSYKIKQIIKQSLLTTNEGIIAALAGMRDREDLTELLSKLHIPVLFIAGKQDARIPLEKVVSQLILPKISESLILSDVGHMGFIEAKDTTFKSIFSFANRYGTK